jgi:hypothetical protein
VREGVCVCVWFVYVSCGPPLGTRAGAFSPPPRPSLASRWPHHPAPLPLACTPSTLLPPPQPPLQTVGVLGAGLMGAGIAQVSVESGYKVLLKDEVLPGLVKGEAQIKAGLDPKVGTLPACLHPTMPCAPPPPPPLPLCTLLRSVASMRV